MSDLSIEMYSTEKSYTFPFKDTSLDPVGINPLEILPKQRLCWKVNIFIVGFKLKYFLSINKQITHISIIM